MTSTSFSTTKTKINHQIKNNNLNNQQQQSTIKRQFPHRHNTTTTPASMDAPPLKSNNDDVDDDGDNNLSSNSNEYESESEKSNSSTCTENSIHLDLNKTQLYEYEIMLNELGTFPDKMLINTLTMIAEDYEKSEGHHYSSIEDKDKEGKEGDNNNDCTISQSDDDDDDDDDGKEDDIGNSSSGTGTNSGIKRKRNTSTKTKKKIKKKNMKSNLNIQNQEPPSTKIYNKIQSLLLSTQIQSNRKLPLVYLLDSILKNVGGKYLTLVSMHAPIWMNQVRTCLKLQSSSLQVSKLKRVWETWRIILPNIECWEKIGECFIKEDLIKKNKLSNSGIAKYSSSVAAGNNTSEGMGGGGGAVTNNGEDKLVLPPLIRKRMQEVLDDMQGGGHVDELEKVSLERLADINPDLLIDIKKAAMMMIDDDNKKEGNIHGNNTNSNNNNSNNNTMNNNNNSSVASSSTNNKNSSSDKEDYNTMNDETILSNYTNGPFTPIMTPSELRFRGEWDNLDIDTVACCRDVIVTLQRRVRNSVTVNNTSTVTNDEDENEKDNNNSDNIPPPPLNAAAAASVVASRLTSDLDRWRIQMVHKGDIVSTNSNSIGVVINHLSNSNTSKKNHIKFGRADPAYFNTEGILKMLTLSMNKDDDTNKVHTMTIGRLYNLGLPFVSSADGRRFGTQLELSKHLDELFRIGQIERSMERSEERGWYINEYSWSSSGTSGASTTNDSGGKGKAGGDADMKTATGSNSNTSDMIHDNNSNKNNGEESSNNKASNTLMKQPADESRDRCAVCGVNFSMHFDQDAGEWMFANCKKANVLLSAQDNNNFTMSSNSNEMVYAHASCLRGLGSPDLLTLDQVVIEVGSGAGGSGTMNG